MMTQFLKQKNHLPKPLHLSFLQVGGGKDKNFEFSIQRQKEGRDLLYILKSEGWAFSCLDIRYVFNTSLWVIMIRNCNSVG